MVEWAQGEIKLIVEDNASQPQQAVRAVQKLIKSDNVLAIVNPFGSGPTAATVKMATDAGVMVFAPWAASGIIQKVSGNSPLLFTTVQNYDSTTANGLAWALKNWKSQKVGVIYQEEFDNWKQLAEGIQDIFKRNANKSSGGQIP